MRKKLAEIWIILSALEHELLLARFGRQNRSLPGLQLIKIPGTRGFVIPQATINDEIIRALQTGSIIAYGNLKKPKPNEMKMEEIHPAEWATLPLQSIWPSNRFSDFRVRRAQAVKVWPELRVKTSSFNAKPKSKYRADLALEIFSKHRGWIGMSQGAAARELAALFSRIPDIYGQPSSATFERWVRDWRGTMAGR